MRTPPIDPFPSPDYRDHFTLSPTTRFGSIDAFVERLVLRQPAWLTKLSMGIGRRSRRRVALDRLRAPESSNPSESSVSSNALGSSGIGNWAIVDRGERHVVFAEDMRIMRYRLTYTLAEGDVVTAETEVEQTTRWFGPVYWALATPLHRRFLPLLLRNAGGPGSRVVDTERSTIAHAA